MWTIKKENLHVSDLFWSGRGQIKRRMIALSVFEYLLSVDQNVSSWGEGNSLHGHQVRCGVGGARSAPNSQHPPGTDAHRPTPDAPSIRDNVNMRLVDP